MRLIHIFTALFCLLAVPALAQTSGPEPLGLVQSFYVKDYDDTKMPMSARLARLYKAAKANGDKLNQPVAGLDFSWTINGQDSEDNFFKTAKFTEISLIENKAVIKVNFRNGGPSELDYELVKEGGRWRVDDIHSRRKPLWTISKMLIIGANEK